MHIIRSKRTVGWLSNRRTLNPPKFVKKGLTKAEKPAIVNEQLEFNFMRAQ